MTTMAALVSAFYVRSAVAYEGDGAHTLDLSLSVVTTRLTCGYYKLPGTTLDSAHAV